MVILSVYRYWRTSGSRGGFGAREESGLSGLYTNVLHSADVGGFGGEWGIRDERRWLIKLLCHRE